VRTKLSEPFIIIETFVRVRSGSQQFARDQDPLYFACSAPDLGVAQQPIEQGERQLERLTHRAMNLNGMIEAPRSPISRAQLDQGRTGAHVFTGIRTTGAIARAT
jgi:hypothetical protein